jgi:hypothetical protein
MTQTEHDAKCWQIFKEALSSNILKGRVIGNEKKMTEAVLELMANTEAIVDAIAPIVGERSEG